MFCFKYLKKEIKRNKWTWSARYGVCQHTAKQPMYIYGEMELNRETSDKRIDQIVVKYDTMNAQFSVYLDRAKSWDGPFVQLFVNFK